jgi:protease I
MHELPPSAQEEAAMGRVAMIVDEMFEDSELRVPYDRLKAAGHEVVIVGREGKKRLSGKRGEETVTTDQAIDDVSASQFDALVIPGGYSPDHLRTNRKMVALTRDLFQAGKPVAAVCHAGWMLVEADIADGHTVTSWPSIKTDMINAGARWVDRPVVEDRNLITSRKPEDLPAFCDAIERQLEGRIPSSVQPSRPTPGSGSTPRPSR